MSANTGDAHTQAGDGSHIFPQENDYHALFEDVIPEDKERFLATLNQEVDINAKQPPYGETVLHLAARKAYASIMTVLLSRGANLEVPDDDGWTPLISACRGGSQQAVELLLLEHSKRLAEDTKDVSQDAAPQDDSNINETAAALIPTLTSSYINTTSEDGSTALTTACLCSTTEVVDLLLKKGADVNTQDDSGDTPLTLAARYGDTKMVDNVLSYNPDIRKFRNDGQSALHQAIQNDNEEDGESIVDRLLEAGLSSTHKDNEGSTPLHIASDYNYLNIVNKLLSQNELIVNAQNNEKETPLHLVCKKGHLDVVQRLIGCPGIELNFQSASSATPLFLAVENEHLEVVTKLLGETGIDINAPDHWESTPLHVACREGYLELAKKLINAKEIELNAKDFFTRTPIFWAFARQNLKVVQTLLNQTGLDLGATDYAERTALHEASEIGSLEIVEMITNRTKEHINAQDDSGLTALHLACRNGHIGVARHLFSEGAKSRVSRDSTQSAWFFFLQYLFESYEDSESREGSISSEDSSMPDPREFEFILEHADKEERASATIWADNNGKRKELAGAMGVPVSKLVDYELIGLAKSLDSSKIVYLLEEQPVSEPQPKSALQWAAYHGRYDVVWWILKSSIPEEKDMGKALEIAKSRRDQPKQTTEVDMEGSRDKNEEEKDFKLTMDMLTDPPVVESAHLESYRKPITSDAQPGVLEAHWATIVDFYERDGQIDLLRRSESVSNVIYSKAGPDNEDRGPEGIMNKARSDLEKISAEAAREKRHEKTDLRMRWIHLPANNMEWMEDLAKRIFTDKKVPASEWHSLNDFLQRSWHELPTDTAPARFMKPGCLKEPTQSLPRIIEEDQRLGIERRPDIDKRPKASNPEGIKEPQGQQSSELQKQTKEFRGQQPSESKKKPKDGRKEDYATGGKAAGSSDPVHGGAVAQKTEYERVALYMPYITFGLCHRKPCTSSIGKEGEAPRKGIENAENDATVMVTHSKDMDQNKKNLAKYDQLIETYKEKTIHGTRSLDQFFYNSLPDMDVRDQNQVFTRSFFKVRNGDGVPQDQQIWPYLAVDQLWLWVIDEETIITSSTHRNDGFHDPVVERLFIQLRQARKRKNAQPPPSSVKDMSHFIVAFCVDFLHSLKWEDFSPMEQPGNNPPDKVRSSDHPLGKNKVSSMSVQFLYEDRVNLAATTEKDLLHRFTVKMNNFQRSKTVEQSHHEERTKIVNHHTELENATEASEVDDIYETNKWALISLAAGLLDEVKDILDELTILKTLVTRQFNVWQELVGEGSRSRSARDPAYTLHGVQEMIEMTDRVQKSVSDILSLEQNRINTDQAQESARQGTILMAFTIVTVVFTPLSFLTSLFALNVTVFQHNSSGDIEYEPGWIFPILFFCSTAIIGLLMMYAFQGQKLSPFLHARMQMFRETWRQTIGEKRRKKASSQGEHNV
ncbi:hypothetical protein PFICI_09892 [Pestalotiopsis fici W106-1]|uniref:Uncharacterized protein n=1 Tax=Pestalotiopsis fici (strain W106-1 / CGMCC3.15140) TaxID=1229662 RepID=W3WVF9_PESFW|nr:uncharacterized protein PFICI_09892 [Pestalotiopsis fici W106-1]ETS77830.1 hypothetical protein PFICI_09892 [Pestalotiopsis fici W106-1]